MPTTREIYDEAVELHHQGRLAEAEDRYRDVLVRDPDHSDTIHNLGLLAHQTGDANLALHLITQAIHRAGPIPLYCANLASLLVDRGDLPAAAACYRQILSVDPAHLPALHQLARIHRDSGQVDESLSCLEQALRVDRGHPITHYELGTVYFQKNALRPAIRHLRFAVRAVPDFPEAHYNLGVAYLRQGSAARAEEHLRQAVALRYAYPEAHINLSLIERTRRNFDAAVDSARTAARLSPRDPFIQHSLGAACRECGLLEEAETAYRTALTLDPDHANSSLDLGSVLLGLNRPTEALAYFDALTDRQPDRAEAHWNASLCHLVMGNWPEGWPRHEWRFRHADSRPRQFSQPRWDGGPVPGKTVLLHAEQGLGDTIQFARYCRSVRDLGARVILACYPSLIPLLRNLDGPDEIVPLNGPYPPFDLHLPLMSLPLVFETQPASVPSAEGYLSADPERVAAWRNRLDQLSPEAGQRVGLVWAGNPNHRNDRNRSMQPEDLTPLASLPGVHWFSLQKDASPEHLARLPKQLSIHNVAPDLTDFAETAAAITALDLVIAVDTSVAHLAGALGQPVWLVIPFAPDWRWMLDRSDTPWYSSMRIFRQQARGGWKTVLEEIAEAATVR